MQNTSKQPESILTGSHSVRIANLRTHMSGKSISAKFLTALALVVSLFVAGACDNSEPVDEDNVQDFSGISSLQDLSTSEGGTCFESKADVCQGAIPSDNSKCYTTTTTGPACNKSCVRTIASPELGKWYNVAIFEGKIIKKDENGKNMRHNVKRGDGCCFMKGNHPIWTADEDIDCAAVYDERDRTSSDGYSWAPSEDDRCLESEADVCAGIFDNVLPESNKNCYETEITGPDCAKSCVRTMVGPGKGRKYKVAQRDGVLLKRGPDGKVLTHIIAKDGCCFRNKDGVPIWTHEQDADCPRDQNKSNTQSNTSSGQPKPMQTPPLNKPAKPNKPAAEPETPDNDSAEANPPADNDAVDTATSPTSPTIDVSNIKCDDDNTWPEEWVRKEQAILAALNAQRKSPKQCEKTVTVYDGNEATNKVVCRAELAAPITSELVIDKKLRTAARCHSLDQARNRCFTHYSNSAVVDPAKENQNAHIQARILESGFKSDENLVFLYSKTLPDETILNYEQDTYKPSEILYHWKDTRSYSTVEETNRMMDMMMRGEYSFMDSYLHCLPIMNQTMFGNTQNCEVERAPYSVVGIGFVDAGALEANNKRICNLPQGADKEIRTVEIDDSLATINFGIPASSTDSN